MNNAKGGAELGIRQIAAANQGIADIFTHLKSGGHYLVQGVSGSQRALLADLLVTSTKAPVLFVTDSLKDAMTLMADYQFFCPDKAYLFPARPTLGAEADAESDELESQRIAALQHVAGGDPCLVVAPATALLELLPPPEYTLASFIELDQGDSLPIEELIAWLALMGYQRVERV